MANTKDNTIAVRVSDETYAKLRQLAHDEEMRVSDVVRRLLRESLKPVEVKA
jgi:predicted CopG family antitoxin